MPAYSWYVTQDNKDSTNRLDTVLAYTGAGLIVASIIALFAVLLAGAMGVESETFASGFWLVLAFFPRIGLPLGFLLVLVLLLTNGIRRRRQSRSTQ